MDMSVSATGSSALREYQKSAGAEAGKAFTEAAQPPIPAPAEGKHVSSLQGFRKLSDKEEAALGPNFGAQNLKNILALQEYLDVMSEQGHEQERRVEEFYGKMQAWLGGPQTATAIPNDPFGPEPVRTSSGGLHPQSERIKDYIRAHKDEWDSMRSFKLPTFEEWQKTRG